MQVPRTEVSAPDTNGLQAVVDATNSILNNTQSTFNQVNATAYSEMHQVPSVGLSKN